MRRGQVGLTLVEIEEAIELMELFASRIDRSLVAGSHAEEQKRGMMST